MRAFFLPFYSSDFCSATPILFEGKVAPPLDHLRTVLLESMPPPKYAVPPEDLRAELDSSGPLPSQPSRSRARSATEEPECTPSGKRLRMEPSYRSKARHLLGADWHVSGLCPTLPGRSPPQLSRGSPSLDREGQPQLGQVQLQIDPLVPVLPDMPPLFPEPLDDFASGLGHIPLIEDLFFAGEGSLCPHSPLPPSLLCRADVPASLPPPRQMGWMSW